MKQATKSAAFLCTVLALTACADDEPKARSVQLSPALTSAQSTKPKLTEPPALTSVAPAVPRSILEPASAPSLLQDKTKQTIDAPKTTKDNPDLEGTAVMEEDVQVDRFVLTSGVEQREPIDEGDTFTTDNDGIFAFVQLANEKASPTEVFVHFEKETDPPLPYGIALQVPTAKRWRTWAVTRIEREPGTYRAVLRTADGKDLATRSFEVVAAD